MGVNIKEEFLQKEEWIDTVKYMSPRPRYNHIELQGEMYLQLKQVAIINTTNLNLDEVYKKIMDRIQKIQKI